MTTESPIELQSNFNAVNRGVYISDNYDFLKQLNSESIDLVNIDPPFKKNETFPADRLKPPLTQDELENEMRLLNHWGITDSRTAIKKGIQWPSDSKIRGGFKDIWSWENDIHEDWLYRLASQHEPISRFIEATRYIRDESTAAYLCFMAIRLIEIKRVLKPSGSIYLHCDQHVNAYLRQLMEIVFGEECFRNEIAWCYTGPSNAQRWLPRKHDTILFFSKSKDRNKFNRDAARIDYRRLSAQNTVTKEGGGIGGRITDDQSAQYTVDGDVAGDYWLEHRDDMSPVGRSPTEHTGYPTQKPWKLAHRIITVSTDPGDVVLDCFAGCAYTAIAAEKAGRQWVACDINPRAWTVLKRQFSKPKLAVLRCNDDTTGQQVIGSEPVVTIHGPDELPVRDDDVADELAPTPLDLPERKFRVPASVIPEREMLRELLELSGYTAWCCGFANRMPSGRVLRTTDNFQLDHIDPKSKQGSNDILNRAPMCPSHNSRKGTRRIHLDDYRKEIAEAGELMVETMGDLVQLPEIRREVELIHTRALNAKYPLLTT